MPNKIPPEITKITAPIAKLIAASILSCFLYSSSLRLFLCSASMAKTSRQADGPYTNEISFFKVSRNSLNLRSLFHNRIADSSSLPLKVFFQKGGSSSRLLSWLKSLHALPHWLSWLAQSARSLPAEMVALMDFTQPVARATHPLIVTGSILAS